MDVRLSVYIKKVRGERNTNRAFNYLILSFQAYSLVATPYEISRSIMWLLISMKLILRLANLFCKIIRLTQSVCDHQQYAKQLSSLVEYHALLFW